MQFVTGCNNIVLSYEVYFSNGESTIAYKENYDSRRISKVRALSFWRAMERNPTDRLKAILKYCDKNINKEAPNVSKDADI